MCKLNLYNYMKKNSLFRSFKFTFCITPFAHIAFIMVEIWQSLLKSISTILIGGLIDSVIAFSKTNTGVNVIIMYAALFGGMYLVTELFDLLYMASINIGIYEKPNNYANLLLAEKAARLKLINFENADILNMYKYAKENINDEYVPYATTRIIYFACRIIEVLSLTIVLTSFNPALFFVALLSVIPYFITRFIRGNEMYQYKTIKIPEERKLQYLWNLFTDKTSAKELRLNGSDNFIKELWLEKNQNNMNGVFALRKKDARSVLLCDCIASIGYAAAVFLCISFALKQTITVGNLGSAIGAFTALQFVMMKFLTAIGEVPEVAAYTKRFFDFLDLPEEQKNIQGVSMTELKNGITLNNVSFSYPNTEKDALHNVSITIQKGESVAIIGENGSGKTTLSKIILGLYEAKTGNVFWDNQNMQEINKEELYKNISIVPQKCVQYNFPLRENIAISNLDELHNDEKIIAALKENEADYILEKTKGLDGMLGRTFGGAELSGGEWQRISLSRCVFKNANILVLDEPTAALDPLEETRVLKKFLHIIAGKTAVIISHRVGLCKLVDKIVVMKDGCVAGIGTHEQLLNSCEEYERLYRGQAELYVL